METEYRKGQNISDEQKEDLWKLHCDFKLNGDGKANLQNLIFGIFPTELGDLTNTKIDTMLKEANDLYNRLCDVKELGWQGRDNKSYLLELLDIAGGYLSENKKGDALFITPDIYLVRQDEIEYWSKNELPVWMPDFTDWCYYLVDISRVTHLCSFQGSHWWEYCEERFAIETDDYDIADRADNWLMECYTEEKSDYRNEHAIQNLDEEDIRHIGAPKCRWSKLGTLEHPGAETYDEKTYDEWMESLIELFVSGEMDVV